MPRDQEFKTLQKQLCKQLRTPKQLVGWSWEVKIWSSQGNSSIFVFKRESWSVKTELFLGYDTVSQIKAFFEAVKPAFLLYRTYFPGKLPTRLITPNPTIAGILYIIISLAAPHLAPCSSYFAKIFETSIDTLLPPDLLTWTRAKLRRSCWSDAKMALIRTKNWGFCQLSYFITR